MKARRGESARTEITVNIFFLTFYLLIFLREREHEGAAETETETEALKQALGSLSGQNLMWSSDTP